MNTRIVTAAELAWIDAFENRMMERDQRRSAAGQAGFINLDGSTGGRRQITDSKGELVWSVGRGIMDPKIEQGGWGELWVEFGVPLPKGRYHS